MSKYRNGRINEEMKKEISNIIREDVKDPRITAMVSVTKVEVTRDLSYAKVYVSLYGNTRSKNETLEALKNSSGFIRREVGHRIRLRNTPEIIIELDNSIEQGMHIDELLRKIKEHE
ncbi:MAG: 30S ribosome-binding factor RbfA [Clostridium sp.]|jgi:ribosome-binding factor A|uniref:30S ribosome-binding factor RbfA n=1 Tax=Clostridium sp. TaxID=1506 RepID=UPI0025C396B2|nr:30S ribosome-binding factor RbfA [Clostridium sp.]MCH3963981.1 30S ribosome-binding factor RbfA [Clostridium sp.]MCI1716182.1 30S ribosome-binding factor RbfA [Clostridium sp.]MCI1800578.1 30S ribosome-binding factor RbfA [Clostridium sp.]MCI1814359.1 30S ribosome-binding factor RbfA [Clostridium sp.]MCI1871258.1 30S ribosome-binding factor RbfA [Clostridium sp.]